VVRCVQLLEDAVETSKVYIVKVDAIYFRQRLLVVVAKGNIVKDNSCKGDFIGRFLLFLRRCCFRPGVEVIDDEVEVCLAAFILLKVNGTVI
jgi:hypothetical protein